MDKDYPGPYAKAIGLSFQMIKRNEVPTTAILCNGLVIELKRYLYNMDHVLPILQLFDERFKSHSARSVNSKLTRIIEKKKKIISRKKVKGYRSLKDLLDQRFEPPTKLPWFRIPRLSKEDFIARHITMEDHPYCQLKKPLSHIEVFPERTRRSCQAYYDSLKRKQQIVEKENENILDSEQCKISIGEHIYKWNELRQKLGLKFDYELAGFLLERYFETLELYEASTLRHGNDSMTMHTEWESPDMADDSHSYSTKEKPLETSHLLYNNENCQVHTHKGTDKVTNSSNVPDFEFHTLSTQSIKSASTLEDEEICSTVHCDIKQEPMDAEMDENFPTSNVDNMSHLKTSKDIKVEPCDNEDTYDQLSHQNENISHESMCDEQSKISELKNSLDANCQKHGDTTKHSQNFSVMSASCQNQNDRKSYSTKEKPLETSHLLYNNENYRVHTHEGTHKVTGSSNVSDFEFHTLSTQSIKSAITLENGEICNTVRYDIKQEPMDTEMDEKFSLSNVDNMSHLKTSKDIKVEPCDNEDTYDQLSHQNENISHESMCDDVQQSKISELKNSLDANCQKHGDTSKHSQDSMTMSASRQNQNDFIDADRLKADLNNSQAHVSNVVYIEVNCGIETEKMYIIPTADLNYAQNDVLNKGSDAGQRCSQ